MAQRLGTAILIALTLGLAACTPLDSGEDRLDGGERPDAPVRTDASMDAGGGGGGDAGAADDAGADDAGADDAGG